MQAIQRVHSALTRATGFMLNTMATAKELFEATCARYWLHESWESEFSPNPHPSPYDLLPDLRKHPDTLKVVIPALHDQLRWPVAVLALKAMNLPRQHDLIEALTAVVRHRTLAEHGVYRMYAMQMLYRLEPQRVKDMGLHRDPHHMGDIGQSIFAVHERAAYYLELMRDQDVNVVRAALRCAFVHARNTLGEDARDHIPLELIESLTTHPDASVRQSALEYIEALDHGPFRRQAKPS